MVWILKVIFAKRSTMSRILDETHPRTCEYFSRDFPLRKRRCCTLSMLAGCSRRETADIMRITCDSVDVLLSDVRVSVDPGRRDPWQF